ncbi:MAG: hypothetical protein GTN70_04270 [Deltaproteobacteria bacterium]|nr:hypothetical protein [Deltaproteobacteria bacterium]NIS76885.1 hypothetical protein [Deltaproteobacteria bacterium]
MGKLKGVIIFFEVVLIGLVLLYIGYGRKGKKGRKKKGSSPDIANDYRESGPDKGSEHPG